ncbi:MAG: cobalamin-binding protein [Bacteroidetes bacterium]|nr:cobalamin-binding protein [Bacteroidota bacterium]
MIRFFQSIARPALAVLLLTQLVACSRPSREKDEPSSHAITVTDDLGRVVSADSAARRVVSLAPSLTEMLFSVGAGAQVIGVTRYCDYPEQARRLPAVGDMLAPDIERILSLDPDLVMISVEGNTQRSFTVLEELGVRVFVSNPRSMEGVYKTLGDIGGLTGRQQRARAVIDSLRAAQRALHAGRPRSDPSVLMLLSLQPLMAAGSSTFIGEVIAMAGGRNATADLQGNYPTLNRETLLRLDPDLVLYPDDMGIDETQIRGSFPEWRQLRAAREGRMYRIDADRYLRPGPRLLEAAAELQRRLAETPKNQR